ncbi:hypothetical protein FOA52_016204 [Chlamydomonas sp. UWO 241]|nr:hypothetical protein FOA52_016204 [Chlamydomonas sp. UWO 241]
MAPIKKKDATKVTFSDIDGTIMHLPGDCNPDSGEALTTPPSASGRVGVISAATIAKVAELRASGIKFVVISGARLSTLLMRLAYLPAGDAYVCENGGRIFYPGSPHTTACPVLEDAEWRQAQDVAGAGPDEQAGVEPTKRVGVLWEWYSTMAADGWVLDANGYTTSFRAHAKNGKTVEELHAMAATKPSGLACSWNLGAADFYPATSGKDMAAQYLMKKWSAEPANAVFLCDDDNDMELASIVGRAFLPTVSSESVEHAVAARPDHFMVATRKGTAASEEMLDAVKAHFNELAS